MTMKVEIVDELIKNCKTQEDIFGRRSYKAIYSIHCRASPAS